jgi:hypothetical protein
VKRLRKENGQTIEDKSEMAQMVTNLFKNLYMADNRVTLEGVTQSFQAKISAMMNESLCSKFTEGEISTTLFYIGPLKALGPDGFSVDFF